MIRRLFIAFCIVFAVIAFDQATKAWILYDLMDPPTIIPVFPFVDIILTWNKGVGFGFLKANTLVGLLGLIGLALGITIGLGIYLLKTTDPINLISLSMIMGGAIGNVIDRIRFGAVLDFIYVHIYIFDYHFPAFNVADSSITLGVCLLFLENYVRKKK